MITLLLQGICIALFSIASGFIFIELKTGINRSFLYWGLSIIILTTFSAIDLWIHPGNSNLLWTNVQHLLICFYSPLVLRYLSIYLNRIDEYKNWINLFFQGGLLLAALFPFNVMLKLKNGIVEPTPLYLLTFIPYLMISVTSIIIFMFKENKTSKNSIINCHIIAFTFLATCGFLDLYRSVFNALFLPEVMSFTILGSIAMGIVLEYNFALLLINMVRADKKHEELELAYKELEEARALSELGKSSAIINHEIRNYTAVISGYAELILLKGQLDNTYGSMVEKIIRNIKNLQSFSDDILDFSKSKILNNLQPLNLSERILKTINLSFSEKVANFDTSKLPENLIIHGDWQKLEHVFMNLFKNSFQAGADKISIKTMKSESTILLTITDNGPGITKGDPQNIFKAFYSTKGRKGTGLGLSITRSIIESHGGHINVVSKNQTSINESGLIFNLSFPNYPETMDDTETIDFSIIIIREGIPNFEEVIRIFRNVFINPEILGSFSDLKNSIAPSDKITVLGGSDSIGELNILYKGQKGYTIVDNPTSGLFAVGNSKDLYKGPLDEEFVLNHLVKKNNK